MTAPLSAGRTEQIAVWSREAVEATATEIGSGLMMQLENPPTTSPNRTLCYKKKGNTCTKQLKNKTEKGLQEF